jgi:putative membrane protein
MNMQPWEMMSWYGMIFGPFMMVLWLVVLVVVVAAVLRWLHGGAASPLSFTGNRKRALEVLEERFARGEIDKDEFQEKKRLLLD